VEAWAAPLASWLVLALGRLGTNARPYPKDLRMLITVLKVGLGASVVSKRRMAAGCLPVSRASFAFDTPAVALASSSERMKASAESIPCRDCP